MPNKPAKYGLKYFNIVDVSTAYLIDTMPYLGKSSEDDKKTKETGIKKQKSGRNFNKKIFWVQ